MVFRHVQCVNGFEFYFGYSSDWERESKCGATAGHCPEEMGSNGTDAYKETEIRSTQCTISKIIIIIIIIKDLTFSDRLPIDSSIREQPFKGHSFWHVHNLIYLRGLLSSSQRHDRRSYDDLPHLVPV